MRIVGKVGQIWRQVDWRHHPADADVRGAWASSVIRSGLRFRDEVEKSMKRDGLESDYDKIRRRAGMPGKPFQEFPDEEVSMRRVEAAHDDFKRNMAELNEREDREREAINARKIEFSLETNERLRVAEYRAAGLEPQPGVSLSMLMMLGWTVQEISGKKTLVRPKTKSKPKSKKNREEIAADSIKESF
jgi:hypothetical protein